MSVRALLGICHVAELAICNVRDATCGGVGDGDFDAVRRAALAWRRARAAIAAYTDKPAIRADGHDRVLSTVVWAVTSLERSRFERARTQDSNLALRIAAALPRLATGCDRELARIQPRLFVRRGMRPLREERVTERLRRKTFPASQADIVPARSALSDAARHSIALASVLCPTTAITARTLPVPRFSSIASKT
jgi:hypothetical protein